MQLSISDVKELLGGSTAQAKEVPFKIGTQYLVRTVTMTIVGRVTRIVGDFVEMEQASWIADAGRFNECWKKSDGFSEVEPITSKQYGFALGAVVDYGEWPHTLPTVTK